MISFGRADRAALLQAYIEPFAKATGINVRSLSYDGEVIELTHMVRGGAPTWDVMQVESRTLAQGCRQGLFEKLDPARLPRRDDLIAGAISACGVGIFTWAQALVYSDQLRDGRRARGRISGTFANSPVSAGCGAAPNIRWRSRCSPTASRPRMCTELSRAKRACGALSISSSRFANDTIWWEAAAAARGAPGRRLGKNEFRLQPVVRPRAGTQPSRAHCLARESL